MMFDIIKTQWDEGCYSKASDLDVYVEAGWITKEQEDEITGVKKAETTPVSTPDTTGSSVQSETVNA